MNFLRKTVLLVFLGLFAGSFPAQAFQSVAYTKADSLLADSILSLAYKNQGLYSLHTDLKPISTVASFTIDFNNSGDCSNIRGTARQFEKLERVSNWLSQSPAYQFVPRRQDVPSPQANVSLVVVNKQRFQEEVGQNPDFWEGLGFNQNHCPRKVLKGLKAVDTSTRHRAFGYLFGYPHYAVDFFVEAHESQHKYGITLPRDFFQIPLYSGDKGGFTYAYPGDEQPRQEDWELLEKAKTTLEAFKTAFEPFREKHPEMPFLKWYLDKQ